MMDEDEEKQRPAKKKKKHQVASEKDSDMTPGIYSFHPEDDELQQVRVRLCDESAAGS